MNAEFEAIALENSLGARRYWDTYSFPVGPGDDKLTYAEFTIHIRVGRPYVSRRDQLLLLCPVR